MNSKPMSAGRLRIADIVHIVIVRFLKLKVVIPWFVGALTMEVISSLAVVPNSTGHLQNATWLTFNARTYQR
jgi:hypothetical protein